MEKIVLDDVIIVVGVDHVMHVEITACPIVHVRYVLPVEAEAAEMLVTAFVVLAAVLEMDAGTVVLSPLTIVVMVTTFEGLIMESSVVSLMPVASVRFNVHNVGTGATGTGVGAVLAEELMMIRSAAAEAVTMTSLSLLTRLKMKMRKTKIKTLPRMDLLPLSLRPRQLIPRQLRRLPRMHAPQLRKRPRKLERQRGKLLVLVPSLLRTLLLLPQLRLHLLRLPKCLDVCIGGISTYTRSFRLLAIHVFVIALGIHMLYPYEEGVKSFSIRV